MTRIFTGPHERSLVQCRVTYVIPYTRSRSVMSSTMITFANQA